MILAGAIRFVRSPGRWLTICLALASLVLDCGAMPPLAAEPSGQLGTTDQVLRLAFSSRMFTEVKVEDARAAMKAWMMTIARERGIPLDPEPKIYNSLEEMLRASQSTSVEGFGITAEEGWRLSKETRLDRVVVGVNSGQISEEYLVLVHRDSGIEGVGGLRGRSLMVLENPRMSLAMVWLDTALLEKGLNPATKFFSRVANVNKLTQVVLPVFFRQYDACLTTRRGFQTMSELNPQVGKQLRVLAASQEVVPTLFAFRSDYASPYRTQMLIEMGRLSDSPAGQQILLLIQADRIVEQPISCLASAFELLATHQRLSSTTNSTRPVGVGLLPSETKPGGNR